MVLILGRRNHQDSTEWVVFVGEAQFGPQSRNLSRFAQSAQRVGRNGGSEIDVLGSPRIAMDGQRGGTDQRGRDTQTHRHLRNLLSQRQRLVRIEHGDSPFEAIARDAQVQAHAKSAARVSREPFAG